MTWQSVIQDAARRRFARNGDCGPFRLARADLAGLCSEIARVQISPGEWDDFVRVQARVPVPDLQMCIVVDEWVGERKLPQLALTLGNPSAVQTALRESIVAAINTAINNSGGTSLLRLRNGSTVLVDFALDGTNPLTLGASDGSATFNPTSATATASGGSATVPNNYQVIAESGTVLLDGPVTGADGITTGQTVTLNTSTLTMPAS